MRSKVWTFDPHSGGDPIPPLKKSETIARLEAHAAKYHAGRYARLEITFRGALCYINAFREPEPPSPRLLSMTGETADEYLTRLRARPVRLGRLRHFNPGRWTYAFYTYSNERYEPAAFPTGNWFGAPEEAFDIGAVYL